MKDKRYSILLVGLVILLATSVVACSQPATTQTNSALSASPPETVAIQPTPRTLTGTGINHVIPLKVGERVEIEVAYIEKMEKTQEIGIASVTDPYGNKIAESATRYYYYKTTFPEIILQKSTQKYPWRYAFIAATDGDYMVQSNFNSALKAVIYP